MMYGFGRVMESINGVGYYDIYNYSALIELIVDSTKTLSNKANLYIKHPRVQK